ncbi:conserved hypothetical protein [Sphingobium sp. SYK-6]|uniref:DUF4054 domain-containing protein n=1 Tax=Sphingobium sp. (strain NBRC 103272 / SYK-6) TaxID=627192 RepID=UPI0002277130|nr:DUF4054 domain-containing protein [Sphingobium sp. SYK-6]BAK66884.1 conserved hypothetical protein [Sphingobium sp. SYK-6]
MAYARLPLADFKAKYVAFPALQEAAYAAWASEAEAEITDAYGTAQQRATELQTAHYLASQGIGGAAGADVLIATGATSVKSGTFSATISDSVVSARAKGGLGSTPYGIELARIQRRLFGSPRLVGCARPCL